MGKSKLKLAKKTEEWLHRSKGADTVTLPTLDNTLRRFRLFGNTQILDTGELRGVGDYNAELGKYVILFRAHGRNLFGNEEYYQAWKESKAYSSISHGTTGFTVYFAPAYNGMVVFDKRHVKFKENTQYTVAGDFLISTDYHLRMRFVYSDGTYSDVKLKKGIKHTLTTRGAATSLPDKTLVSINAYTEVDTKYTAYMKYMGIYEGSYDTHDECYELYNGEDFEYRLYAPLMSIGYTSDELDLMTGNVTRKIHTEAIDGSASVEHKYSEGIYVITPKVPMRVGTRLLSSLPVMDETQITEAEIGVALCEGGKICVKLPGVTDEGGFISYLNENPFTVTYVMKDSVKEMAEVTLPQRDTLSIIDVFTEVTPRKFYAEYV